MVRANPAVTSGWRVLLLVAPVQIVIVSATAAAAPPQRSRLLLVVALGDEHRPQAQRLAFPHLRKKVPRAVGLARQPVEAELREFAHRCLASRALRPG